MGGPVFILAISIFLCIVPAKSFESYRLKLRVRNYENPELIGGASHPCYRKCIAGETRTCDYTFILSQYTSMSYACRDCPRNKTDCFRDSCVTAGGYVRPITVANHMLPGPSIQVCENDKIRVKVVNTFTSESTTIHWHGVHQLTSPWMDGTPFVTQCPILPHNEFLYEFAATPAGTHMWHSHIGFQEADGLHGSLIIRRSQDPISQYYDYDLAEHVMIIWHWFDTSTAFQLKTALDRHTHVSGRGFLINGLSPQAEINIDGTNYTTPRKVFTVEWGKKYRFRTIFNSAVSCPVQISIDRHRMRMIASETGTFEPLKVDSFMADSGERYDFVLHAKKRPADYKIRFRGLGACRGKHVSEFAVLRYINAETVLPSDRLDNDEPVRSGVLLNPVNATESDYPDATLMTIATLNDTTPGAPDVTGTPNHVFYLNIAFNTYGSYFAPGPYPQINNLSFEYPPVPLLTESEHITSDMYCTESNDTAKQCVDGLCTCPMIYRVGKNSLVEIVVVQSGPRAGAPHPMHLHGHHFRVVAMQNLEPNTTFDNVKEANEAGLIVKRLEKGPMKDNISLPSRGFVIIRFIAKNPGYWLFHCHIGNHAEMGMIIVMKVGEDYEMIKPSSDFPKCGKTTCRI